MSKLIARICFAFRKEFSFFLTVSGHARMGFTCPISLSFTTFVLWCRCCVLLKSFNEIKSFVNSVTKVFCMNYSDVIALIYLSLECFVGCVM